jgi:putative PIN family toxin of toxin-antitoxin system
MRVVVDTGVLVSGLIRRNGITGEVLTALRDNRFNLIYSTPIVMEIIDVLSRPLFRDKHHIQPDDITSLVNLIRMRGELVAKTQKVEICRDPKDDKFLEAALAGKVDAIVSGDNDLIVLHPFEGIPILHPREFIAKLL